MRLHTATAGIEAAKMTAVATGNWACVLDGRGFGAIVQLVRFYCLPFSSSSNLLCVLFSLFPRRFTWPPSHPHHASALVAALISSLRMPNCSHAFRCAALPAHLLLLLLRFCLGSLSFAVVLASFSSASAIVYRLKSKSFPSSSVWLCACNFFPSMRCAFCWLTLMIIEYSDERPYLFHIHSIPLLYNAISAFARCILHVSKHIQRTTHQTHSHPNTDRARVYVASVSVALAVFLLANIIDRDDEVFCASIYVAFFFSSR